MDLTYRSFNLAKSGNLADESEDACCIDLGKKRFALADGATQSSFPRVWAQILTTGFVEEPVVLPRKSPGKKANQVNSKWLMDWLQPLQAKWVQGLSDVKLPYFARDRFRLGAYATFLGLQLFEPPQNGDRCLRWQAVAVGDSVLFRLRIGQTQLSFPLNSSIDFGNVTSLIGSRRFANETLMDKVRFRYGVCRPGDIFILSTDAMAHWFFTQRETGANPWSLLDKLGCDEDFSQLILEARATDRIPNDDTSLIIIRVA
jgi:hypothetical protein